MLSVPTFRICLYRVSTSYDSHIHYLPPMYPTMVLVTVDPVSSSIFNNPWAQPIAGPSGSQLTPQISEVTSDGGRPQSDSSDDSSDEAPPGKGKRALVPKQTHARSRPQVCWYISLSLLGLTKTSRILLHKLNGLRYLTQVARWLKM